MKYAFIILSAILSGGCNKNYLKTRNALLKIFVYSEIHDLSTNITLGPPIEGAAVHLYTNQDDLRNRRNEVGRGKASGPDGLVTFDDLEPIPYFILAEKDCLSNLVLNIPGHYTNSTGRALESGKQLGIGTQLRSWIDFTISNNSGLVCDLAIESEFWFDANGPYYNIVLQPGEIVSYKMQPAGTYFLFILRKGGAKTQERLGSKVCGTAVRYSIQ